MTTTKTPQGANEATIGAVASTAGLGAWLPIETAPKDGTGIIVCGDTGNVWCNVKWEKRPRAGERWEHFALGALRFNPTHWMPIPKAPNAVVQADSRGLMREVAPGTES